MQFLKSHKWVSILPVIAMMAVIFLFSAQDSVRSDKLSQGAGTGIFQIVVKFLGVPGEKRDAYVEAMQFPIRKGAHMAEYAALGFLIGFSLFVYEHRGKRWYIMSQGLASLYAVTDEIHQYFVPGRSCEIRDMLVDSAGAFCGICLLFLLLKRNGKAKRDERKKPFA